MIVGRSTFIVAVLNEHSIRSMQTVLAPLLARSAILKLTGKLRRNQLIQGRLRSRSTRPESDDNVGLSSVMAWKNEELLVSLLAGAVYLTVAHTLLPHVSQGSEIPLAIRSVLGEESDPRCTIFIIEDGSGSASFVFTDFHFWSPCGVGVYKMTRDGNTNVTRAQLSWVVHQARQLRQVSWCVTVVVVSDDSAFLADVTKWGVKGSLLAWSTKLLIVTRLPLPQLHQIYSTFSMTNSMLLIVEDILKMLRCSVYIYLPYSSARDSAIRLAIWSPQHGLTLTTSLPVFPDKYIRFLRRPTLAVAMEGFYLREAGKVQEGVRHHYVMDYLAQGLNFTYKYVSPADGTYGSKQKDGSWSGMVGMVSRQEADFAPGPFGITANRTEVVDITWPVLIQYTRILSSRGTPQVNPWAFLLPLQTNVWASTLVVFLVLPAVMWLLSSFLFARKAFLHTWGKEIFDMTRILLQQDYSTSALAEWKRLVMAGWVTVALVLSKSYAGNLMSSLAVRHIHQPYQTIRNVLDDRMVTMLWATNSSSVQYFRTVESGIFREIADVESKGRIKYILLSDFPQAIKTLVKRGDHVLMEIEAVINLIIGKHFTSAGRCDFYLSKERFLPMIMAMIGQKNSPLVPALSRRIMSMTEAGLYNQWMKYINPNATSCMYYPSSITVTTSLSLANLWGMFVVLLVGHLLAYFVLCVEMHTNTSHINLLS
ncbi:probable glutamate receptor [Cherax quadricarinatus]|uniref:probable glutamate receptor n=1 Tax=Cherax quadricarinatus TaxID=27406 RepID=UPI00387E97E7